MFCPECGTDLRMVPQNQFCPRCGNMIPIGMNECPNCRPQQQPQQQPQQKPQKTKKPVIWLVIGLVVLAALIGGIFFMRGGLPLGGGYADDKAMDAVARGLEARWDLADPDADPSDVTSDEFRDAVNAELDAVGPLRNREFENLQMRDDILEYIDILEESLDVIDSYPRDSPEFHDGWVECYGKRAAMLRHFVDAYGLTVDESYQSEMDALLAYAETDYADDEAMEFIASGLEARWDLARAKTSSSGTASDEYRNAVNAELDVISSLRDREFQDQQMQDDVLEYIGILEDSLDVIDSYPSDSSEFHDGWVESYEERATMVKHFVDAYDLTVDESYQSDMDTLLTSAK